jgi:hypothetical protein
MRIVDVLFAPGCGAFFYDDQAAIRAGVESDGFLYRSTPCIGLVLASDEVARGDMMSVQYAGASGRDPVFRAAVVQPRLAGLDGREFRAMWRWSRTTTGGCRSLSSMAWDRGAHDQGALLPPHRWGQWRNGRAAMPGLEASGPRRQRQFRACGCKSKPPWGLPRHFDFADGDVEVSQLIAMSCPDVRFIDQDHHLRRWIGFRFEIRLRYRRPREISRDTVRSIAHGRVAHRIAGQASY